MLRDLLENGLSRDRRGNSPGIRDLTDAKSLAGQNHVYRLPDRPLLDGGLDRVDHRFDRALDRPGHCVVARLRQENLGLLAGHAEIASRRPDQATPKRPLQRECRPIKRVHPAVERPEREVVGGADLARPLGLKRKQTPALTGAT